MPQYHIEITPKVNKLALDPQIDSNTFYQMLPASVKAKNVIVEFNNNGFVTFSYGSDIGLSDLTAAEVTAARNALKSRPECRKEISTEQANKLFWGDNIV